MNVSPGEMVAIAETLKLCKEILALQWLLGNVLILGVFGFGIFLYFFAGKALKAFKPKDYKLPSRWLIVYCVICVLSILVFNFFPQSIPARPEVDQILQAVGKK